MDWSQYYPAYIGPETERQAGSKTLIKAVTVADIGCGFGGLLIALSPVLKDELLLGKEELPAMTYLPDMV